MDWSDEGFVLAARRHGESSVVVQLFTRSQGRHAGLVRGGAGTKARGIYQPGNLVAARWRGRLAEHLGSYSCELTGAHAAAVLDDPLRLAALASACAVSEAALPERHPYPLLYDAFAALVGGLVGSPSAGPPSAGPPSAGPPPESLAWAAVYVRWEVGLLEELGFGLDLAACAATGSNDELAYVSPKTGRAVSLSAGEPYRERLLALPGFLIGSGMAEAVDIADGLRLTGHFLERHLFAPYNRGIPGARERFVERFTRATTTSGVISEP